METCPVPVTGFPAEHPLSGGPIKKRKTHMVSLEASRATRGSARIMDRSIPRTPSDTTLSAMETCPVPVTEIPPIPAKNPLRDLFAEVDTSISNLGQSSTSLDRMQTRLKSLSVISNPIPTPKRTLGDDESTEYNEFDAPDIGPIKKRKTRMVSYADSRATRGSARIMDRSIREG